MRFPVLGIFALVGCYSFSTTVHLDDARGLAFSKRDEAAAVQEVIGTTSSLGLAEDQETLEILSSYPPTESYGFNAIVILRGGPEHPHVSVVGEISFDRTSMRFGVQDLEARGPTPFTSRLVEAIRAVLTSAFPDHRIEVKERRKPRALGPWSSGANRSKRSDPTVDAVDEVPRSTAPTT